MDLELAKWIPWIPALGAVICGICCWWPMTRQLAGWVCAACLLTAFGLTLGTFSTDLDGGQVVTLMQWITIGEGMEGVVGGAVLEANFSYYLDSLTQVMLLVVTGIGSLVAIYAGGYMLGDRGYARFFLAVCLFIFAMTTMVMADNLVLLFFGWEMVGLASYLLIGFYYRKPSAVAAAKKAFIVNRVADFGFLLGIFLAYQCFGSVRYEAIIPAAQALLGTVNPADLSPIALAAYEQATSISQTQDFLLRLVPLLLLLGALGKSAQIPFHVWLPDAMEGPSPVSALIHAATMVTSGVYMVARLLPMFEYSSFQIAGQSITALGIVATIGGCTALFAATIALCQNDLKRIFAFSTVSQLGYMFLGVGVLSPTGGIFHLVSHAFFKGLLFLTAGSVMHAMAGQLDIRKMSGLRHKMPVTCWLMFAACLALAGFPLTGAFFSKDMIIAYTFERGMGEQGHWWYLVLGFMVLLTAFITASYGFRAWFRVFWGPEQYEMGHEAHDPEPENAYDAAEQAGKSEQHHAAVAAEDEPRVHETPGHDDHHHHEPHEMPWFPMNLPLVLLAVGAIFGGLFAIVGGVEGVKYGWIGAMIDHSTASTAHHVHEKYYLLGIELHLLMMIVSGIVAISAIALAAYLHVINRDAAAKLADRFKGVVKVLANKYYVDEIYHRIFVLPLRIASLLLFIFDRLVIDAVVSLVGTAPKYVGYMIRPTQDGKLQGYAISMVLGVGAIVVLIFITVTRAMGGG